MNGVVIIIKLAKLIRTPKQALVLFVVCGVVIAIAYLIPAEMLEKTV